MLAILGLAVVVLLVLDILRYQHRLERVFLHLVLLLLDHSILNFLLFFLLKLIEPVDHVVAGFVFFKTFVRLRVV